MSERPGRRLSRRALLTTAAATGAVAATGAAAGGVLLADGDATPSATSVPASTEPFHGKHQPGIAAPQQRHALFAAFDLETTDPVKRTRRSAEQLATVFGTLMEQWTLVTANLMAGREPGLRPAGSPQAPADSGVADGLAPARLTLTFGLGPELFERIGRADRRPRALEPLPAFENDRLEDAWCGGDLLVQICADDAQVLSRAFRTLRSRTPGSARLRWTQQGFLGAFGDATPRNLFGHKDGTANPRPGDTGFDAAVWADPAAGPAWFTDGTYLVFRKIRMDLPKWDTSPAHVQDQVIGRRRDNGAPLSGGHEFTTPDLTKTGPDGEPLIPADSHLALVRDIPMLRRSYNYDYGIQGTAEPTETGHRHAGHDHGPGMPAHSGSGHDRYDSGVLFCAYLRDPEQFVRAQRRLATDRLNAFIRHTGSAVFAIPPGARPDRPLAAGLLSAR
ncbi:iron uptake transporter deferrochelatase/peroxidase subunit [Actinomadura kijaniata]|uniref:Dye decolorizing peroxidase/deferrochelatase/peroxidase EfeB n=1 Tax=Actinomadura namibiensis TaxID=182080 RepID=A0A7W3QMJ3_ACTNM|nr:Dyp-type peroxidase [Actinomadura namibiensis]MBA8952632.1 dye decolorizing peroxidase/deferrochelatase/peroxidase EfeB [Actinomadura namibiensis]